MHKSRWMSRERRNSLICGFVLQFLAMVLTFLYILIVLDAREWLGAQIFLWMIVIFLKSFSAYAFLGDSILLLWKKARWWFFLAIFPLQFIEGVWLAKKCLQSGSAPLYYLLSYWLFSWGWRVIGAIILHRRIEAQMITGRRRRKQAKRTAKLKFIQYEKGRQEDKRKLLNEERRKIFEVYSQLAGTLRRSTSLQDVQKRIDQTLQDHLEVSEIREQSQELKESLRKEAKRIELRAEYDAKKEIFGEDFPQSMFEEQLRSICSESMPYSEFEQSASVIQSLIRQIEQGRLADYQDRKRKADEEQQTRDRQEAERKAAADRELQMRQESQKLEEEKLRMEAEVYTMRRSFKDAIRAEANGHPITDDEIASEVEYRLKQWMKGRPA